MRSGPFLLTSQEEPEADPEHLDKKPSPGPGEEEETGRRTCTQPQIIVFLILPTIHRGKVHHCAALHQPEQG